MRVKSKIINISLVLLIISMLFSFSCVFADSFDTTGGVTRSNGSVNDNSGFHRDDSGVATGTRYVVRINKQDLPKHYWISQKSGGDIYIGGTRIYDADAKRDKGTNLFEGDTHNIVRKWYNNNNTDNFGLDQSSVDNILNAIKGVADGIGDTNVSNTMTSCLEGKTGYEIRAEIIFTKCKFYANGSGYWPSVFNISLNGKDMQGISLTFEKGANIYSFNNAPFMSYRELFEMRRQIAEQITAYMIQNGKTSSKGYPDISKKTLGTTSYLYNDCIVGNDGFQSVVGRLFEKDAPYTEEYSSYAINAKGINYGGIDYPDALMDGFDYIFRGGPENNEETPTTVTAYYRWENDIHSDALHDPEGKEPEVEFGPVEIEGYTYRGDYSWRYDSFNSIAENVVANSITVPKNELNNQVIFWYKRNPKITVKYVVQKGLGYAEGDWFGPYRGDEIINAGDFVNAHNENPNYYLNGLTLDGANIEYTDETKYALNDGNDHTYIFWYKPYVVIRYLKDDGTELLKNEKIYGFSTATAPKDKDGYLLTQLRRYAGGDLSNGNIIGAANSNNINSGKYIGDLTSIRPIDDFEDGYVHTYTFWYQNLIVLRYKDIDTKKEIHDPGSCLKGGTASYEVIANYDYEGVQITKPYNDPKDGYNKTDSINLKNRLDVTEVTFWYKNKSTQPKVTVKYVLLKDKNDKLTTGTAIKEMNPNPKTYRFKNSNDKKNFTINQMKEIKTINGIDIKNYKFAKSSLDGVETNNEKVLVQNNGKDREVVFGFYLIPSNKISVKVIGVCEENLATKTFVPSEDVSVPYKKTYNATDYKWEGYELITNGKNTCIVYDARMWIGEKPDKTGGKADINQTTVPPNEILVIFFYKRIIPTNETIVDIYYKDIKTEKNIMDPVFDVKPAVGTHTAPKNIDDWVSNKLYSLRENGKEIANKKEGTSVTIKDNKKRNEIIFWYDKGSDEIPNVTAKWVLLQNSKLTEDNFTNSKNILVLSKVNDLSKDRKYTKDQINEAMTSLNLTFVGAKIDNEKPDGSITEHNFTNDGSNHTIIFGFTAGNVPVRVIKVIKSGNSVYFEQELQEDLTLPISKSYSRPKWKTFEPADGNNIKRINGSLIYLGQDPDGRGDTIPLSVKIDEYENVKKGILLVFYYKANMLTVKHINITKNEQIGKTEKTVLIPGQNKVLTSISNETNLSYNAKLDGQENVPNLKVDGLVTYSPERFTATITPDNKDHELVFEYVTQYINVRHEYENGKLIKKPERIEVPTTVAKLDNYVYVGNKLNGTPGTESELNIKPNPDIKGDQTIIFIYREPGVFIDDHDPNGIAAKLGCGISVNTMNNQYIKQKDEKYWVLDEKGTLTITYANDDMKDTKVGGTKAKITFPFDVIINGVLKEAGKEYEYDLIEGSPVKKRLGDVTYNVYTSQITGIQIPIWAQEGVYSNQIKATVTQNFNIETYNEITDSMEKEIKGKSSSATASVTIIGAVYDFSVTNIDGNTTTGDSMWKASLITNPILTVARKSNGAVEYETNILPIGQATQQNAKYAYGIKLGTRFYFSVNTKGAKSTSVEITPKFYYFDKSGNGGKEVTVRSGNTDITNLTRTTSLTDANRTTAEYQKELAQGKTTYGANTYSNTKPTIFANKLITIGTGLRTPFINYGKDPTSSKYHEISTTGDMNKIYRNVSHWYADYVIPNNATFYGSDGKVLTEGFVLVTFSIKTKAGNYEYLAYNLSSPFASSKQSEWTYEGATNVTLPKTATLTSGKGIGNMIREGSGAVAYASAVIYQISGTTRTSQNVDSTGTH